jgi:hypothetical protein
MFSVIDSSRVLGFASPRSLACRVNGCTVPEIVTTGAEFNSCVIRLARCVVWEATVTAIARTTAHTAVHLFQLFTARSRINFIQIPSEKM